MFTHSDDHCQLDSCYGQRPDCGYRRQMSAVDSMPMPDPVEAMREWQRRELLIQKFEQQDADARAIEAGDDPLHNQIEDGGHVFDRHWKSEQCLGCEALNCKFHESSKGN